MINTLILCTLLGIAIGVFAAVFSKKGLEVELPVKLTTNNGWNWTVWKKPIGNYALATLKKGTRDIMIIADNDTIIIQFNGKIVSINNRKI